HRQARRRCVASWQVASQRRRHSDKGVSNSHRLPPSPLSDLPTPLETAEKVMHEGEVSEATVCVKLCWQWTGPSCCCSLPMIVFGPPKRRGFFAPWHAAQAAQGRGRRHCRALLACSARHGRLLGAYLPSSPFPAPPPRQRHQPLHVHHHQPPV